MRAFKLIRIVTLLLLILATATPAKAQGTPIGFEETFALASDRSRALEELIPGTEEYYFYSCLHAQNEGRLGDAQQFLTDWHKRLGRNQRFKSMEMRQALLKYPEDPDGSIRFLISELGLKFDHRRMVRGLSPNLPTQLDPNLISYATLLRRALSSNNSIGDVEDRALSQLVGLELKERQLADLLSRLDRPDLSGISALVVRDLNTKRSRGFGSLTIHNRLLLEQLDECARLKPELLQDPKFVAAYLKRLAPNADADRRDPEVILQHLTRLEAFAGRLSPAFTSLLAHVRHHRLAHDLARGQANLERFLTYLRMPRATNYGDSNWLRGKSVADLSSSWNTDLRAVGNDEQLVRAYLEQFFQAGSSLEPFVGPLLRPYVERIYAETQILSGTGDMERWFTMLGDPNYYELLKARVELEFPVTQRADFKLGEDVRLRLDVKNVETLIVKIFEIDTLAFFESQTTDQLRDIDASIDLDGLVASREFTFTYDEPALRRVRRDFVFDDLEGQGVWVIDFIGGGLSSRTVVRKDSLSMLERQGPAGHQFQILGGSNEIILDSSIHFAGRQYTADSKGRIAIPYSTEPGIRKILLRQGDFAVLDYFAHGHENYRLEAGFHVERESLISGETATFLVRPRLSLNGSPVSLSLLQDVTLQIDSTDLDGVASSQTVREFELFRDRASTHSIQVPARTASITVSIHAQVENLSTGETDTLNAGSKSFTINAIDRGTDLFTGLLTRTSNGYALDLLGKNGETVSEQALRVDFKHRDFRSTVNTHLKSDENGRVNLGQLQDIESMSVNGAYSATLSWYLMPHLRSGTPQALFGTVGGELRIAYEGKSRNLTGSVASLLELRNQLPTRNCFGNLSLVEGFIELSNLEPGDYELRLHETNQRLPVHITEGPRRSGWGIGRTRRVELSDPTPFQILSSALEDDVLVIRLANPGSSTRVHVSATRYLPRFDPHTDLAFEQLRGLRQARSPISESLLASGRTISDEYRYILERRLAQKFPGNMLARAGTLLNPWAIDDSTDTTLGLQGAMGQAFGGRAGEAKVLRDSMAPSSAALRSRLNASTSANLDFLPSPASVLWNLLPDQEGVLRIPLSELGSNHIVRVVAVDRGVTDSETVIRDENKLEPRDGRLPKSLDLERHFAEQRRIEFVKAGQSVELGDLTFSGIRTLDSLTAIFQLFVTIGGQAELAKFEFLTRWPSLSDEEKREQYSEYASHEVHVFLREKDAEFFESVIRPYLSNKAEKTFVDLWLLERDLSEFLEPWAFARLNIVERILLLRNVDGLAARHVRELVELMPTSTFAIANYFNSVLATGALDANDGLSRQLSNMKEEARRVAVNAPAPGKGHASDEAFFRGQDNRAEKKDKDSESMLESLGYSGGMAEAEEDAIGQRADVRRFFRDVPDTKELAESNYWHVRFSQMNANLVTANPFWLDFAETTSGGPFVSARFPLATGSTTEMLLALAFLDLPFEAKEHELSNNAGNTVLVPGSDLYLVRKEIAEAATPDAAPAVLVGQDFLRINDAFIIEDGVRRDRFVEDEFLAHEAYTCRVVVTNPSSSPLDVDVLLQIPEGAMPLRNGFETRGVPVVLSAYASRAIEYAFYFPTPGAFPHYPVHVSQNGSLLGNAAPQSLNVVEVPSVIDTVSWQYVSQEADVDALFNYLDQVNLGQIDLSMIAWRMRDRSIYERVITLLRDRNTYEPLLWSYSFRHKDERSMREMMERWEYDRRFCGLALRSPLLSIDPVTRGLYEHLEYDPLIHGRAHQFGDKPVILNRSLSTQYLAYLRVLAYLPELDDAQQMESAYYLALQDRVGEALEVFAGIDPTKLEMRVQYDYMRAYFDFFTGDLVDARQIATAYSDHPVSRWRSRFRDVIEQLDEAEGKGSAEITDPTNPDQQQTALAASEPSIELNVEAGVVKLLLANVERLEVSYRKMDIELLFSTNPFLQAGSSSFAYIKPNRVDLIEVDASRGSHEFALPEEFRSSNVLIEVRSGGVVRQQPYYAGDLAVQSLANYGQILVREASTGRLLPATYVKVYAKLSDGTHRFHKDGYTDIRGRFDYVSLSGMDDADVEQFAVLVMTEADGALVRELAPPAR